MSTNASVEIAPVEIKHSSPHHVCIPVDDVVLMGDLAVPPGAGGVIVCLGARSACAAGMIRENGSATLRIDLFTPQERHEDDLTHCLRFNINLMAGRLVAITRWLAKQPQTAHFGFGYFGEEMTGAAALAAAAELGVFIDAVVCRQSRPDFAANALPKVEAATLLICDKSNHPLLEMNRVALARLRCEKQLQLIPDSNTDKGVRDCARDYVGCTLAARWFKSYVRGR